MKIRFRKIEIHNFLSYSDSSFDFDGTKGMNLITGRNLDIPGSKNGVGKSGWALALTYGLFGELPFKLGNRNIPNRFISDNHTRVCVWFDSGRKHYKVVSGMKNKQSYCGLYELSSGEERDITKSTIAETRGYIERELLNSDINLFMRTIFLNSDPSYNFYNLPKKDKKEFIDKLFDISIYGDMFQIIHADAREMEKNLMLQQNDLISITRNLEDYSARSEEFDKNKKKSAEEIQNKLSLAREVLDEKNSVVVSRNEDLNRKFQKYSEKINDGISRAKIEIQKLEYGLRMIEGEMRSNDGKVKDFRGIISKHDTLKGKLCEDCQVVFARHYKIDMYQREIEKLLASNENKRIEVEKTKASLGEKNSELKKLTDAKNTLMEKERELNREYENAMNERKAAENEVNSLKYSLENLEKSANPYVDMIRKATDSKNEKESSISEIKETYKYVKFLEGIVDQENLKKYIIKDLIGVLNGKIRHYLHRLGANYDIIFDENMDYEFNTQDITGAEFHNFSSGEQARISIATCFAFRDFLSMRNSVDSNILILDEFIDSNVDSQAIENIVDILKEFSSANRQNIYLVSHRQEVGVENFDRIIEITKKDNVSSINVKKVQ